MTKPLLDVLRGVKPERRPVWFMRQAGRYLPEYRAVRSQAGGFLDLCYNPTLASEVTLQPLRRFDIDAAILFADILVVPHAMGVDVGFKEGEGPVVGTVRSEADVLRLGSVVASYQVKRVCETVAEVKERLPRHVGLIGFCGGPWTVASYMVEGGSSDRERAKIAAYSGAGWFVDLIDVLVRESVEYLSAQIEAGAEVVQIFDSWAGELVGRARRLFVFEPLIKMVDALKSRHPDVPVIVFARGLGVDHVELMKRCRADAFGIESELAVDWLVGECREDAVVQGNLDPVLLLSGWYSIKPELRHILKSISFERHVFNLGHGRRVGTEPAIVGQIVNEIRRFDAEEVCG